MQLKKGFSVRLWLLCNSNLLSLIRMFKENVRNSNNDLHLGRKIKVMGASFGEVSPSLHARVFLEILEFWGEFDPLSFH